MKKSSFVKPVSLRIFLGSSSDVLTGLRSTCLSYKDTCVAVNKGCIQISGGVLDFSFTHFSLQLSDSPPSNVARPSDTLSSSDRARGAQPHTSHRNLPWPGHSFSEPPASFPVSQWAIPALMLYEGAQGDRTRGSQYTGGAWMGKAGTMQRWIL